MSHTPGPWKVTAREDGSFSVFVDEPELLLIAERSQIWMLTDEFKANARLIASAPDLLAVLEELDRYFVTGDEQVPMDMRMRIHETILKARGEWNE